MKNYRIISCFIVLAVLTLLLYPRVGKFQYEYQKGRPWVYETLISPIDFPILKTDEQLREERGRNKPVVIPYYRYRRDLVDNSLKAAADLDFGGHSSMRPQVLSALESIYSNGVVSDEGVKLDKGDDPATAVIYVQKDKRAAKKPASEAKQVRFFRK